MAQPVLAACGLQQGDALPPLTLIKQHSGVDGSFLIAAVLGHRLKSSRDNHVLLVATQHTYHHYSSAGMKLGFNLAPARDSGQLQILDVGAELYRNYPNSANLSDVTNRIRNFLESHPGGTVLVDDLTYFLNFGHSEAELIDFVEQLQLDAPKSHLVLKVNTADLYGTLCANLDDLARIEIRLERLASGQFREVDGRLSVSRFPQTEDGPEQALMEVKQLEKSVLYKVNDRNVKVFVPGEVGIKNL